MKFYCVKCCQTKDDFAFSTERTVNAYTWCYSCLAEPERRRRMQAREKNKRWREGQKRKGKRRAYSYHLKATYKISIEEFEVMAAAQKNRCAICLKETDRLCVDHDHTTSVIRGLLCHSCNALLGYAHEQPGRLRGAAMYLEFHRANQQAAVMAISQKQAEAAVVAKEALAKIGIIS